MSGCHTSLNEGYEYPEILENGPTRLLRDNWFVLDTVWAQKPKKLTPWLSLTNHKECN